MEKECRECGKEFTDQEVESMLICLFGSTEHIDGDVLVENYGLCPGCWINID